MTENSAEMLFERDRQLLVGKGIGELEMIVAEPFENAYPSDGLYSGSLTERIWQFVLNRVKSACDAAGALGNRVWEALSDEHTAHNVERFSLVCGFFASEVFPGTRWPAHEMAALVLLIIAIRSRDTSRGKR